MTEYKKKRTEFSPFNFKTEERKSNRRSFLGEASAEREDSLFRAREMPKYKFFEVKLSPHKKILFKEFQLATEKRLQEK